MSTSRRLKELFENSGLSYAQLEELTGISKSVLQRYASGETKKIPTDAIEVIAEKLHASPVYLTGWDEPAAQADKAASPLAHEKSNVIMLKQSKVRMVPHFQSASAGFGIMADSQVINYIPLFIESDAEAMDTMCIDVCGDSMYPKIENGDTIVVRRQSSVDSGSIAVVLVDKEDALVKRVVYDDEHIELQSINPEYAPKIFRGSDMLRIQVVGLVRKIIKNV